MREPECIEKAASSLLYLNSKELPGVSLPSAGPGSKSVNVYCVAEYKYLCRNTGNKSMKYIDFIRKRVEKAAEEENSILAVFLLGSAAAGTLRPDSDIDLGVISEPGVELGALKRLEIAGALSYELGRTVDIGVVSSRNLVYAREALLKGKLLYSKDRDRVNLIRANLLGMYVQFNMERKEVVDAYTAG